MKKKKWEEFSVGLSHDGVEVYIIYGNIGLMWIKLFDIVLIYGILEVGILISYHLRRLVIWIWLNYYEYNLSRGIIILDWKKYLFSFNRNQIISL